MRCYRVRIGDVSAIVSVGGKAPALRMCSACHRLETRLCDWKVGGTKAEPRTCDKPMCGSVACGSSPAPGKDLCLVHTKAYAEMLKKKAEQSPAEDQQKKLL